MSTRVTSKSLPLQFLSEDEAPVPVALELPAFPAMLPFALFCVSLLAVPEVELRSLFAVVFMLLLPLGFEPEFEAIADCSVPCTRT